MLRHPVPRYGSVQTLTCEQVKVLRLNPSRPFAVGPLFKAY
jgi:hypothetical protein